MATHNYSFFSNTFNPQTEAGKEEEQKKFVTDFNAAKVLFKLLIDDPLSAYQGAEKILAIQTLFLLIKKTRPIFSPKLSSEKEGVGDFTVAEKELQDLIDEKIAELPESEEKMTEAEGEQLEKTIEATLVTGLLGPLAEAQFRDLALSAALDIEDKNEAMVQVSSDIDTTKLAEMFAKEMPGIDSYTTPEELTEEDVTKLAVKVFNILSMSRQGKFGIRLQKYKLGGITRAQVIRKIKTLEELRKTVPLQEGGGGLLIKIVTALLALIGGGSGITTIEPPVIASEPLALGAPANIEEPPSAMVPVTPASTPFNLTSVASRAALAISQERTRKLLDNSGILKRVMNVIESAVNTPRDATMTAPRYDVTILNKVWGTLKDLQTMINQNPAIINILERILVEAVLISFTRGTVPPETVACADDGCVTEKLKEYMDDEELGEIVEDKMEIKTMIRNIATGNITHTLIRSILIIKEQTYTEAILSWAKDLFVGSEVASSKKAAMIHRIVLSVEEKQKDGTTTNKSIFIHGNNLNLLRDLAAVYGPLKDSRIIDTYIGKYFFDFLNYPGAQELGFITLASINPSRILSDDSTSPELLSILAGFKELNAAAIQRAFYNYANFVHEKASSIVEVGNEGLLIGKELAIPPDVILAAHTALVEIQDITAQLYGPTGVAFLGGDITIESANKSIALFEAGLGNLTADNPITIAVKDAKAGLVYVGTQLKELAVETTGIVFKIGLNGVRATGVVMTTLALLIPLIIPVISSAYQKTAWWTPWGWITFTGDIIKNTAIIASAATSATMIGYILGGPGFFSAGISISLYYIYGKEFITYLQEKLKAPGVSGGSGGSGGTAAPVAAPAAPEPEPAPVAAPAAVAPAVGAPPEPEPAPEPAPAAGAPGGEAPAAGAGSNGRPAITTKSKERRRARSEGRGGQGGGYRMTGKNRRKTDKSKHKSTKSKKTRRKRRV
jgi:hypothetical protein